MLVGLLLLVTRAVAALAPSTAASTTRCADQMIFRVQTNSDESLDLELAPLRRLLWVRPGPFEPQEL